MLRLGLVSYLKDSITKYKARTSCLEFFKIYRVTSILAINAVCPVLYRHEFHLFLNCSYTDVERILDGPAGITAVQHPYNIAKVVL